MLSGHLALQQRRDPRMAATRRRPEPIPMRTPRTGEMLRRLRRLPILAWLGGLPRARGGAVVKACRTTGVLAPWALEATTLESSYRKGGCRKRNCFTAPEVATKNDHSAGKQLWKSHRRGNHRN